MTDNFDAFQINAGYVEEIYESYKQDPSSVDLHWIQFFEGAQHSNFDAVFEFKIAQFVQAWKTYGHLHATTNILGLKPKKQKLLSHETYGLVAADFGKQTSAGILAGLGFLSVADLIQKLEEKFAGTVGAEIEHVQNPEERQWLYSEFAKIYAPLNNETQLAIYKELAQTDALEKTIATKYIGKKRFSIEGADAQIPACEAFLDESAALGVKECVVSIAHRGRLNFLVNVVGKPLDQLFAEFEGYPDENIWGEGDVKYHGGFESERTTRSGKKIAVAMPFNPSHLEYVACVAMGDVRARQAFYHNSDTDKVVSLAFHGDAAIAGQGTVYENAQMMSLSGYSIGGTVHVVANNQVGFTTNPADARTGTYCTEVAKVTSSPVFHINADDQTALCNLMRLCARYRAKFKKDIYVDLVCFRRFGHNEADEPTFTQPCLYKLVKEKPAPYETYMQVLVDKKIGLQEELQKIYTDLRAAMNVVFDKVKANHTPIAQYKPLRDAGELLLVTEVEMLKESNTTYDIEKIKSLAEKICTLPEGFHVNSKLARIIVADRKDMGLGNKPVDWGMAELLAYATLLQEGYSVRLAGEDAQRGTFAHRHGVLIDSEDDQKHNVLSDINPKVKVEIVNSLLSEEAAMGYEYGYAVRHTKALTLWEGQFGDFANGAQVIIDQFIASGEAKWWQSQGLVLLLPNGFEGQGAEHSSARLERFLQMCADGNMQVCSFTNAKQLYHALRRQLLRPFRKPLILMTPKSFLRSQHVTTSLEDLAKGKFEEILDDVRVQKSNVTRVLLCSGKIAIDMLDAFEKDEFKVFSTTTALVRIEQLYPLHTEKLQNILSAYKNAKLFAWLQEEPANMGAWQFVRQPIESCLRNLSFGNVLYFGRRARPSTAVGLEKRHLLEQQKIIHAALESMTSVEV